MTYNAWLWLSQVIEEKKHFWKYLGNWENHIIAKVIVGVAGAVRPMYNDHPLNPKFVAVVDKWSLFRVSFMFQKRNTRIWMYFWKF